MDDDGNETIRERWVLQIMLQSPSIAVASLSKCKNVGPGNTAYWPNFHYPMGLAKVDIEDRMPSSAYRKSMEGIECMGICPASTSTVADLGASPGGWTSVVRKYFGCRVHVVDRSSLDPVLMRDEMVIQGDAVAFEPPDNMGEDSWMNQTSASSVVSRLVLLWQSNPGNFVCLTWLTSPNAIILTLRSLNIKSAVCVR